MPRMSIPLLILILVAAARRFGSGTDLPSGNFPLNED